MSEPTILRTQVGIIGGGPSGLLLSHLLRLSGIDNTVLELRDREYTVARVRAGVLEHDAVDLLTSAGLGERIAREGLKHQGIYLQFAGERHHVDFSELIDRDIWVYGQQEVMKDLIAAHDAAGTPARYEISDAQPQDLLTDAPSIRYTENGEKFELRCDFVVGADGFHGVARPSIPADQSAVHEREYHFAWLGILAHVAPSTDELIYSLHERGFAMHSMRSNKVSRLYLQVEPDDDIENWSDDRIWDELDIRLRIFEKSITPMRSFVSEPMSYGRMHLVGDAAHIVPPTGAKGLNQAIADVALLHNGLVDHFRSGNSAGLEAYSATSVERVWKTQYFSTYMTRMLHRFHGTDDAEFDYQVQLGQLRQLISSRHAMAALAELYTGLPMPKLH
jgi:p-hydroxybenzoate 3-monooxygenase